jgi:uncharacterized protein YbjT (DUF2867 family)
MSRIALILGATGLVGRECVHQFAESPEFSRVVTLTRRPLRDAHHAKIERHVVDFERLDDAKERFRVSHIVCALGTTIRKAGSQASFRRVDHDYPLMAARLGVQEGARHFLLVSALGANPRSRLFYNRVKGEVEQAIRALPYRSVTIARPSILLGDREESRIGETIGKALSMFAPRRIKAVPARDVAAALLRAALEDAPGVRVIESKDLHRA